MREKTRPFHSQFIFLLLVFSGLSIRLFLSPWVAHFDVYVIAWTGRTALHQGLDWVYKAQSPCPPNQADCIQHPPGSVYLWSFSQFLLDRSVSHQDLKETNYQSLMNFFYKLPAVLGDLVLAMIGFWFWPKKRFLTRVAAFSLIFFNPALIYVSSLWGQYDSVVAAFAYVGLFFLVRNNIAAGVIFWVLSLFIKLTLIVLAPLFGVVFILEKARFLKGGAVAVGVISLALIPFQKNFFWLLDYWRNLLYWHRAVMTANATNFWGMFFHPRSYISDQVRVGPVEAAQIGLFLFAIVYVFVGLVSWQRRKEITRYVFPAATLITYAAFLFLPRMHERYLFPALFPLLFWCLQSGSKLLLAGYLAVSGLFFLNLYVVAPFFNTPLLSEVAAYYASGEMTFPRVVGLGHLVVFFNLCWLFLKMPRGKFR